VRGLRGQLTLVYTLALVAGLLLFAALSLLVLDRSARTTLDARLISEGRTITSLFEVRSGHVVIEETDRTQFQQLLGVKLSGAVYDAGGKQLLTTSVPVPSQVYQLAHKHPQEITLATVGPSDGALRVVTVPILDGKRVAGVAVLWRSLDSIQDLDRRSALVFASAIPVIVAFAIFFGTLVAKRGLAPLGRLADLASDIEAHDLSRRLGMATGDDELGRLCAAFDRMLDRLQTAFERERTFTGDASHELRGPLSVIRAEAELSLRRTRSQDEYRQTLETIVREADALEKLTSDLLAAARAHDRTASPGEPVDFASIVEKVCERLGVLGRARNVSVDLFRPAQLMLCGNESDFARLVFAVVHNAVKYSLEEGTVHVSLTTHEDRARLEVRDQGPGFSAAALKNAFERFWRDDEMRSHEGSGLGLSIAQRIAQNLGGELVLRNNADGASVVATLPLAGERNPVVQQDRK